MKRSLCLLLFFMQLFSCALASDALVYDAADAAGDVVNAQPPLSGSVFTPLDVVLVLDASGSMARQNSRNGKQLISYAQDAAITFAQTLFAINPDSRVGVVCYEGAVTMVSPLCGRQDETELLRAIRSITTGNMTNTGGGFDMAAAMLKEGARPGGSRMVLMLSDGLANEGAADPVAYAIEAGLRAADEAAVYTVGLVGGLSDSDRQMTRQVLSAGYQQQYYEVDFAQVDSIGAELALRFTAAGAHAVMKGDGCAYLIWADGALDVLIADTQGMALSSGMGGECTSTDFGHMAYLGDENDEKLALVVDGRYQVRLHGTHTMQGSYRILRITPDGEEVLAAETLAVHPALCYTLDLGGGSVTRTDESYDPLNLLAVDPFTRERTRGLELPVNHALAAKVSVMAAPGKKSASVGSAAKGLGVSLLATDPDTGWTLIGYLDGDGLYSRGWVSPIATTGYVPQMIYLNEPYTLARDAQLYRAPGMQAAQAGSAAAGTAVNVLHAECDASGREWAYVELLSAKKKTWVYLPADALEGWKLTVPPGFRLGYAVPAPQWQIQLGANGYTEVMWAAADVDHVVLSGRTSSKKGVLKATEGSRDAFALRLAPYGEVYDAVTSGGGDWDSYHCIVPSNGGYYVSGVTRSNNGDFRGIWDPSSHTNGASATTSKTNALVGRLNGDFSISWLKSFGVGKASYGFDMVVELADGNIAGAGWLSQSSSGAIRGYGKQDFYVVKLTPDGQVLAARAFGTGMYDVPDSAVATPDGGMIMVGHSGEDGYILVLDAALNVVNECRYGGSGKDVFDNIRMLPDGTYLVTGFTDSPSVNGMGVSRGGMDFWAMNIDGMGRSIWMRRYGGSGDDELCGTVILDDGTCLLLGSTTSTDGDITGRSASRKADAWAVCINLQGRMLWQYIASTTGDDAFNTAAVDPSDGGFVLAGICMHKSSDSALGLVVKLDVPTSFALERSKK